MAVISQFTDFALHSHTTTPVGNITPTAIGDLCVRTDTGGLYVATTVVNTGWIEVSAQNITALGDLAWLLNDNSATALDVGSTGLTNLLRFITTNGAELMEYRGANPLNIVTGGLTVTAGTVTIGESLLASLFTAVADYAVDTLTPTFVVRTDHAGGNVEDAFTLPARTGGWRLVDAFVRSRGGTAGNLTLLDATGGNAMTDAIVPGNADVVTRAGSLVQAQEDVATGAVPVWSGAGGPPATTCYSYWVGL